MSTHSVGETVRPCSVARNLTLVHIDGLRVKSMCVKIGCPRQYVMSRKKSDGIMSRKI
jgi:hypothetical protein